MADKADESSVNITVAARVRPFNRREKDRGAQSVLKISGQNIRIEDPNSRAAFRDYEFDYVYDENTDQEKIFQDIGIGIVEKSLQGYNCAVYAYGQTAAGKSHTILGYDYENEQGICPRILNKLFLETEKRQNNGEIIQICISVLEVYNEKVFDLLAKKREGSLQIREHPKDKSFYVQNLRTFLVKDKAGAKNLLDKAIRNRTIAATMMNATSSRSHMIVSINLNGRDTPTSAGFSSKMLILDLAGSESASSSGTSGQRRVEASNINKSMSTLGRVFTALYDKSQGQKKVIAPYRESTITCLLKDALGGNSYTVMIANISPADVNYIETRHTLGNARKARHIRNYPKSNRTRTDKLLYDLQKETQRVKELIKDTTEKIALTEKEVTSNEDVSETYDEEEKFDTTDQFFAEEEPEVTEPKKKLEGVPYLTNLHEDSTLSGKVIHYIEKGSSITIGNPRESTSDTPEVMLLRARIAKKHAMLKNVNGSVKVMPLGGPVYINGKKVPVDEMQLEHNDRIMFGKSYDSIYVFKDPLNESKVQSRTTDHINYDYAKREIARYADVEIYLSSEDIWLRELIVRLEQIVEEANAMAKELSRQVTYDIILISALSLDEVKDMCHIFILCRHTSKDKTREFLWTEDDFYDRFAMMTTEYGNIGQQSDISESEIENEQKQHDPFVQPTEASRLIGAVFVPLSSLSCLRKMEEQFDISSTKTNGHVNIGVCPCKKDGEEINDYIDPTELLGRELDFKIKIMGAKDLPAEFNQTWCQYGFYMDSEDVETEVKFGRNPNYDFCKRYGQTNVTQNFIEYLESNQLIIQVFGKEIIDTESKEALKEKIKELREPKKAKHAQLSEKKKEVKALKGTVDGKDKLLGEKEMENKELKRAVDEKDILLRKIAEKVKGSNDPLSPIKPEMAKSIAELLKGKI